VKKTNEAVASVFSVKPLPDVSPAETAPQEDDTVKLSAHLSCLQDDAPGAQPGLPSAHQLLSLHVKQITTFLG
jgi:hypothetical protein